MPRHSALRHLFADRAPRLLAPRRLAGLLLAVALLAALLPGVVLEKHTPTTAHLGALSDGPTSPGAAALHGTVPETGNTGALFTMAAVALGHAVPWPGSPMSLETRPWPGGSTNRTGALADVPPRAPAAVPPGIQSRATLAGLFDVPARQEGVSPVARPVLGIVAVFLRQGRPPVRRPRTSRLPLALARHVRPAGADVPARPSAAAATAVAQPIFRNRAQVWLTGYDLTGVTATGAQAGPGICAVDPSYIPLGTRVTIDGLGSCLAADTGPAVVGAHIDLWVPTASDAFALTGWYTVEW